MFTVQSTCTLTYAFSIWLCSVFGYRLLGTTLLKACTVSIYANSFLPASRTMHSLTSLLQHNDSTFYIALSYTFKSQQNF